jgi:hypothetical protein
MTSWSEQLYVGYLGLQNLHAMPFSSNLFPKMLFCAVSKSPVNGCGLIPSPRRPNLPRQNLQILRRKSGLQTSGILPVLLTVPKGLGKRIDRQKRSGASRNRLNWAAD